MKKLSWIAIVVTMTSISTGCSFNENACEDVTEVARQAQQCQILQREITNAKGDVIRRSELDRRYQQDCIDLRYYRDEQQLAICGNKEQVKKEFDQTTSSKP